MVGTSNLGSWNGRWSWFGQIPAVDAQTAVLKKLLQSTSHTHTYIYIYNHIYIYYLFMKLLYIYIYVCIYIYGFVWKLDNKWYPFHWFIIILLWTWSFQRYPRVPSPGSAGLDIITKFILGIWITLNFSGSGHSNGLLWKWMNMAQLWMIYDDLPIQMIKLMIKKWLLSTAFIGLPKVYTFSESLKQYSLTTWLW